MNTSSHFLMRKGKRSAAMFVQAECSRSTESNHFKELLSILLSPLRPIDDTEVVDWIKWLVAGGKTPTEFSGIVRSYDNGTTCGLVWTANFVAYRCRTCGISPCMSLCAECFQRGNHDGHDFNMFRSQAGGACDCGDASVMKEAGFCDRHGPHAQLGKPLLPPNLLVVAEVAMPYILLRLILHLRSHSIPDELGSQLQAVNSADFFIAMLHDFSGMGAAMRQVITSTLLNSQVYSQLLEIQPGDSESAAFVRRAHQMYQRTLVNLKGPEATDECQDFAGLKEVLEHRTFLEEMVFWTVKFEFPQKLVCLLLNMLPDPVYKEAFTRAFVLHYARISRLLVGSADPDTLSNRVVHVSVQLFSNEELAMKMVEELRLLHVMVISLKDMMSKILIPSTLQDPKKNFHFVVDCSKHVMKDHCYWPLVSDLSNLLSHRPVALQFLADSSLLRMWFTFLSMFQGMNVNKREMGSHVDFEPNTYYAAFSAELEAPASAMWALAIHLRDSSTVSLTTMLLKHCQVALEEWLQAISLHSPEQNDAYQVSFHIPLHRYLAAFTSQAVRSQGIPLKDILPQNHLLQLIMVHPLRIQAAFYEILSGLWVRNGLQIKGQAMSYIQCHFGNSMVDADIYLLQLCAMQLSPDMLLPLIFERFHVLGCLSLQNGTKSSFLEGEQESSMLESCLIFLASLMALRTNIGANESELDRLEMISLLCMGDRTHSQLMELLPEKCGAPQNKDFDAILTQVADYKAPNFEASGSMQQGMYVPKPLVWEELYDPIYVLLRAVHRRDFQTSLDRFTQYIRQSGKHPNLASGTLWPPFRLPISVHRGYEDPRKALLSRTFHSIVFVLLYKAVYLPSQINEQTLALVIYLLDLAISFCLEQSTTNANEVRSEKTMNRHSADYIDLKFSSWFYGDSLHENICTVINQITLSSTQSVVIGNTEELDVDSSSSSSNSVGDSAYQAMDLDAPEPGLREGSHFSLGDQISRTSANLPSSRTHLGTDQPVTSRGANALDGRSISEFYNLSSPTQLEAMGAAQAQLPLVQSNFMDRTSTNECSKSVNSERNSSCCANPGSSCSASCDHPSTSGVNLQRLTIRESIISLLVRLYSTFGGQLDKYHVSEVLNVDGSTKPSFTSDTFKDGRIGDGRYWISKILDKVCYLHPNVQCAVKSTIESLHRSYPSKPAYFSGVEELSETDKKRKIKERQQRLLQEFANKQREFMQHAMATEQMETDLENPPSDSKTPSPHPEPSHSSYNSAHEPSKEFQRPTALPSYDCVICNQSSPSTFERPICLVVLLQSTNLPQKSCSPNESMQLPLSSDQVVEFQRLQRVAIKEKKQRIEYSKKFSGTFSFFEFREGGRIYVQTCGHYLHFDCQKQYLQALRTQQRHQAIDVERGEYACPLCRQLANSALPVIQELQPSCNVSVESDPCSSESVSQIMELLNKENGVVSSAELTTMKAMREVIEDMFSLSGVYQKHSDSSSSPGNVSCFLRATARANIEIELMQRNYSLSHGPCHEEGSIDFKSDSKVEMKTTEKNSHSFDSAAQSVKNDSFQEQLISESYSSKGFVSNSWPLLPKRSCLASLFYVLGTQRKGFSLKPIRNLWKKLTSVDFDVLRNHFEKVENPEDEGAALLFYDPTSLLLEIALCLPLPIKKHQFQCLSQHLFNFLIAQLVFQRVQTMSNEEKQFYEGNSNRDWPLSTLVSAIIRQFDGCSLDADEARSTAFYPEKERSFQEEIENSLYERALNFLRLIALLHFHFYRDSFPVIKRNPTPRNEFLALSSYVNVNWKGALGKDDFIKLVGNWCNEFKLSSGLRREASEIIALHYRRFFTPRLLVLPRAYDAIFQFYHRTTCEHCMLVPKEPSVCLSCGTLVCLRESCCKSDNMHEAVQHSIECGVGTAIFLAINSSTIIVVRGKRACLWGSVYLDVFGEEDRELKRGKPLYLSTERFELLEQQWLSHRFDHTNKKWIWHRDAL